LRSYRQPGAIRSTWRVEATAMPVSRAASAA
jgi:hypothetical protein